MVMTALLLFSGVTFAEGPPGGREEDVEFCTEEQIYTDPSDCPGSWASSSDLVAEAPAPADADEPDALQPFFGCDFDTRGDYPHQANDPPG